MEVIVLRLIHVLGGIVWVGGAAFNAFFLIPAMTSAGPSAGPVMAGLQRRRMMTVLPIVALLTILSGIRLLMIRGAMAPAFFQSTQGMTFSIAGGIAILAFVVGWVLVRPAMMKAGQLAAAQATAPESERASMGAEIGRLRRRGAIGNTLVTYAVFLSAAGMAVARYL